MGHPEPDVEPVPASPELCTRWSWIRPNGQLADMAARSFLNKLHARALIQLPPCRRASPNRMKHRQLECVAVDSRPVEGELSQLGALHLHEVSRDPERRAVFETSWPRTLSGLPQPGGREPQVSAVHRAGSSGGRLAVRRRGLAV